MQGLVLLQLYKMPLSIYSYSLLVTFYIHFCKYVPILSVGDGKGAEFASS